MKSEIASELSDLGLKLTPQRIEIMRALSENIKRHPTLNELHEIIRGRMPSVSFSTLFNTINTLERVGYLRIFDLEGETRVELNPNDHINIIDRKRGTVTDLDDEETVKKVLDTVRSRGLMGKKVLINVIIYDG